MLICFKRKAMQWACRTERWEDAKSRRASKICSSYCL